jgi:ABC-type phosphate/phosphonate transport system permease subunit
MRRLLALAVGLLLLPWPVLASEEPATALEHRVNTAGLSGIDLTLAHYYNERRLLYAVVTTVAMAVCGVVIAFVVDLVLGRLGLRVSKLDHRE